MEITECTKIIHDRIIEFDPENVIKIIGYLLLTCKPNELTQLALGPDEQIFSIANEAKASLGSSPKPNVGVPLPPDHPLQSMPTSPTISRPFLSPSSFRVQSWEPRNNPFGIYRNQPDLVSLEEQLRPLNPIGPDFSSNFYYPDVQLGGVLSSRGSLRSPTGLPEYSSKPCHYFYNGHCRHGNSCRYSHSQVIPDRYYNLNLNDLVNDDYGISPGSLEELEIEISELLKERKGMPVSIAALPMMYIDKYGKALQCDGYLTESQRHGKSGYSLTKLLAQLRTVRLIDRPHGQHSVILAEDAAKYTAYHNDRSVSGALLASSHQIYLTFPAESTFTDEDVLKYFKQFGPVRDVRIPRQEKRMFGFVSFLYPETVRLILDRSHPHIICGSRVLVKPYKEKSRFYDRKYPEKMDLPMYYPSQGFELESDFNTVPGLYENSILLNKHLIAECEQAIENERMRLMEMQLASKSRTPQHFSSFGIENLNISKDNLTSFPVARNNRSPSDDKPPETGTNCIDQESGRVELPDSPFASPRLSG